jgi:hypothetical protein
MQLNDAPSVQRILFGRPEGIRIQAGHNVPYVLGFCGHGSQSFPGRVTVPDRAIENIFAAARNLAPYDMLPQNGPYTDKDGQVKRLAIELNTGNAPFIAILERVIDILRPVVPSDSTSSIAESMFPRRFHSDSFSFIYDENYTTVPDVVSNAGSILTQKERRVLSLGTNVSSIALTHLMESFLLATAALRELGIPAYPSFAALYSPQHGREAYTPMLSIIGHDDVPLRTFALLRSHPDMDSLIVLSDTAMMGVLNVLVAETRAKHLCVDLVEQSKHGLSIPQETIVNQLQRIANALFEGHKLWPETRFIHDAVVVFTSEVAKAMAVINLSEKNVHDSLGQFADQLIGAFSSPATFGEISSYLQQAISDDRLIQILDSLLAGAAKIREQYGTAILGALSTCIRTGQPFQTFEYNRKQP